MKEQQEVAVDFVFVYLVVYLLSALGGQDLLSENRDL
jgi:hypothetical protein